VVFRERIIQHIEPFFQGFDLSRTEELEVLAVTEEYVDVAFKITRGEENLVVIAGDEQVPDRLIRFDVLAGAGFLASLVGGILSGRDPILLGTVIISSLAAITNLVDRATRSEALLFWVVFKAEGHRARRNEAQEQFAEYCRERPEIEPEDFHAALQELLSIGLLSQESDQVYVTEKMVFVWAKM
jgi:DNA integrity scanning protein DisA with diadenylate cyclase activity